jgi:hypothetical protein
MLNEFCQYKYACDLCYVTIVVYESIYRHSESVTQLPFEIIIAMPPIDHGKRGYSNEYILSLN